MHETKCYDPRLDPTQGPCGLPQQPKVHEVFDVVTELSCSLRDKVRMLEERLSCVLTPETTQDTPEPANTVCKIDPMSLMASRGSELAGQLRSIKTTVESILERLEI
jgi:hypothetical protein